MIISLIEQYLKKVLPSTSDYSFLSGQVKESSLPAYRPRIISTFNNKIGTNKFDQAIQVLLKRRLGLLPREKLDIADDSQVSQVLMGEYDISSKDKRYLETFSAASCVAVTIYAPEISQSALTHMDCYTDVPTTLCKMKADLHLNPFLTASTRFEVGIFDGVLSMKSSRRMIKEVHDAISSWNSTLVVEEDTLNDPKDIIIDGYTGTIFDLEQVRKRIEDHNLNLRLGRRHSKALGLKQITGRYPAADRVNQGSSFLEELLKINTAEREH